jgi:hypothetical protein
VAHPGRVDGAPEALLRRDHDVALQLLHLRRRGLGPGREVAVRIRRPTDLNNP